VNMSTITKTVEEFSSRRKIGYGMGASDQPQYTLTPSTAALSPHKHFYGKDQDGNEAYFVEFNIGDFSFDEISIRTEGHRLIVQGRSKLNTPAAANYSREFTRDFTLPAEVDQFSIKAQLDEVTRKLSLIGQVIDAPVSQTSLGSSSSSSCKLGSIKEKSTSSGIDYEIFVGFDLKDGSVNIEAPTDSALVVRVTKKDSDKYGDATLELKRTIKLAADANINAIEQGLNPRTAICHIKVPRK